jgi:Uma2 family endonuclease
VREDYFVTPLDPRTHSYTYADYLDWPANRSGELIGGTAYIREPPAPSPVHQGLLVEMCGQARSALRGRSCRVFVAPFDVRLPRGTEGDGEIDTVVQPDVFIVCDLRKVDGRGMRGAPDWVAEILSPSSSRHDQMVKVPVYERAGVREVWLVDPIEWTLTIYRLEGGRYACAGPQRLQGRTALTAVPGVVIDWDQALGQLV